MTKPEALKLMRLISAMESWMMAQGKVVSDYLLEDAESAIKLLEREILGPDSWPEMKGVMA